MWKNKFVLSVIPARGGSVGIKGKNLRKVVGKSLLRHAIETSNKSKLIDLTTITSDSQEILNEALDVGIDLCINRPYELSTSDASSLDTWIHAWNYAEKFMKKSFEYSVLIQPTSPNRTVEELKKCFNLLSDENLGMVTTLSKVPSHYNPEKILFNKDNKYRFFNEEGPNSNNRHYLPSYFYRNGNFYVSTKSHLINHRYFLEKNIGFNLSETDPINIDEEIDLTIANILMDKS